MKKNIVILGSSGSIGENALRVVEALPGRFGVVGLAVRRNYRRVLEQARRFNVRAVAVEDPAAAEACRRRAPRGVRVYAGPEGLEKLAGLARADVVVCAVVGTAGLRPVMAAIEAGTDVALATKEVLVSAGDMVMRACARRGVRMLPVDSEHSAVFQCLEGRDPAGVRRILLTASGGPFGSRPRVNFDRVTLQEVLAHPRWVMGRKVTVDSATMMNKGLEVMEAHWLFGVPLRQIEVVVHPESIVHSLVEFRDGSMLAQLSLPDMRFAIQYALTCPGRLESGLPAMNLARLGALHFAAPDERRFPCLRLAREAAEAGGTLPAVLYAANEVAVQRFLRGELRFSGIWHTVEAVMSRHRAVRRPDLSDVIEADRWARSEAEDAG